MPTLASIHEGAKQLANYAPLAAALLAPASTLYDIPALTEKWYSFEGLDLEDPRASLILSGFSLAISILANAFLVIRFSVRWSKAWRWATRLSLAGWVLKTIIGVANLITFGALRRNGVGFAYNQGFWCAIVSVVISGIIALFLISHYTLSFSYEPDSELRFQGRAIITSELLLFALLALNALIFSRIEGWSYLDAIYFSVVSILSIGFGDFSPTHTSTKILLFPYFIAGISLLANQISIIVNATSYRSNARRIQFRERYASKIAERQSKHGKRKDASDGDILLEEIRRLRKQAEAEENTTEIVELLYSACTLVSFWLLGALIFHFMEGWSYGDSLYFNYVFLFTIGYGDFSPETPVGRVVFVIWALISVPIMTQFVVQTIQTITAHASKVLALATSQKRNERERVRKEFFAPHASYLEEAIEGINESSSSASSPSTSSDAAEEEREDDERIKREAADPEEISVQKDLLYDLLSTASLLETQARGMIVDNMDKHSHARLLLQADGNVQLYTLKKLGAEKQLSKLKKIDEIIKEGDDAELERVRQYRKTYAKLLVIGSKLMQFEGDQLSAYQRRRPHKGDE